MVAEPIDFTMGRRRVMMTADKGKGEPSNVITGDAKVIDAKIMQVRYPSAAIAFLSRMRITTFGDQGHHRRAGRDEHFCLFELIEWADDMRMARSQVIRTRNRLVEAHIITFTPHPTVPGRGIVGWNMNTDEWQHIGPKGGAHNAEGNPLFQDTEYQAALHTLKAKQDAYKKESSCQSVNGGLSKCKSTPDKSAVKVLKHASLNDSDSQAPKAPLRRVTEEDQELTDANASGDAAIAVAPVAVAPVRHQRKATRTETPPAGQARASPDGEDTPLNVYRAACWKLLRDKYGQDVAKEGRELAAMKRLFEKKIPLEDVERCWHATLLDPRWDTEALTIAIIEEKLTVYRRNPDGYRQGMQKKRNDQEQRDKRGNTNGNPRTIQQSPVEHHVSRNRSNTF
jgi:hypothetical protein